MALILHFIFTVAYLEPEPEMKHEDLKPVFTFQINIFSPILVQVRHKSYFNLFHRFLVRTYHCASTNFPSFEENNGNKKRVRTTWKI